jgi:hypothetical protein
MRPSAISGFPQPDARGLRRSSSIDIPSGAPRFAGGGFLFAGREPPALGFTRRAVPPGTARHILRGQPAPLGFVRCASGAFFPAQLRLVPALTMIGHKIPDALRGVAHPATSRVANSERRADQSAIGHAAPSSGSGGG